MILRGVISGGRFLVWRREIANWFRRLFGIETPEEKGEKAANELARVLRDSQPVLLYAWECRQYRAVPSAWWFNPDRYLDTPFQWPDPTIDEVETAWREAIAEARELYGSKAVDELVRKMAADTDKYHIADRGNPVPGLMARYGVKPSKGRYQTVS